MSRKSISDEGQQSLFDNMVTDDPMYMNSQKMAIEIGEEEIEIKGMSETETMFFDNEPNSQNSVVENLDRAGGNHQKHLFWLKEHHRMLSEQMMIVNREIARIALKGGSLENIKARELLERLHNLKDQREAIEIETRSELKSSQELERRPATAPRNVDKTGLVKVRHPNRDFFSPIFLTTHSKTTARAWKHLSSHFQQNLIYPYGNGRAKMATNR